MTSKQKSQKICELCKHKHHQYCGHTVCSCWVQICEKFAPKKSHCLCCLEKDACYCVKMGNKRCHCKSVSESEKAKSESNANVVKRGGGVVIGYGSGLTQGIEDNRATENSLADEIIETAMKIFHISNDNSTNGKQYEAVKKIVEKTMQETIKRVFEELDTIEIVCAICSRERSERTMYSPSIEVKWHDCPHGKRFGVE